NVCEEHGVETGVFEHLGMATPEFQIQILCGIGTRMSPQPRRLMGGNNHIERAEKHSVIVSRKFRESCSETSSSPCASMTCCLRVSAPLSPASGEGCIDGSCSSRSTPKERIVALHEKLSGAPWSLHN